MKSSHRKTFTKLKEQNSLLRSTKDQINSETYQIWLDSKERLFALKHEVPDDITDFYDLKSTKVHSPNVGLKSKTHNTNHRKQLRKLFDSKDWQDTLREVEVRIGDSELNDKNKEIRGKMDNKKSLKYKLSVQRNWQNNATIIKKDF